MGEVVRNGLLLQSFLNHSFVVWGFLCLVLCRAGPPVVAGKKNGTSTRSCDAQDEAVLLQLATDYNEFRGGDPFDCCRSWENVRANVRLECSNSSRRWERRVTALFFLGDDARLGPFPQAICNLTALSNLSLRLAGLSGPLPPCLFTHGSLPRLSVLDLAFNSLSGPLPASLLSVHPLLSFLDVSFNSLSGSLPSFTSNSSALEIFVASFNLLNGSIPSSFEALQSLIQLELAGNGLSGIIPPQLGSLSKLRFLNLQNNGLSGNIPHQLGSLSNLESLSLSFNRLSGTLPPQLGSLAHLQSLHLSNNELHSAPFPAFLGNLSSLNSLSLQYNSFNSTIPAEWQNLTNLIGLGLSGNALSAHPTLPDWIFRLPLMILSLSSLNLSSSQFSCDRLRFLNVSLLQLDISVNHISASSHIFQCLSRQVSFQMLNYFNISNNPLNTLLPSSPLLPSPLGGGSFTDMSRCGLIGQLPKTFFSYRVHGLILTHNNLRGTIPLIMASATFHLDLSFNAFTGTIPPHLANCTVLRILKLASNHLKGTIPRELGMLSELKTLSLRGNHLEGAIPSTLSNCSSLQVLDLSHNLLTGDLNKIFTHATTKSQNPSSLQVLLLDDNNLTGPIPASLGSSLPLLQVLGLSRNLLMGIIPPQLDLPALKKSSAQSTSNTLRDNTLYEEITLLVKGRELLFSYILIVLTSIDFSDNLLSGFIPPQLGELVGLQYLNLSKNNLSGSIPAELSKLQALESLDLAFNSLTGSIPKEMGTISTLGKFNVSFNKGLVGLIPLGPQLEVLDSYLGDDLLCGLPKPPCEERQIANRQKTFHQADHRSHLIQSVQRWASLPGIAVGFMLGFLGTVCSFNLRSIREIYHRVCATM